MRATYGKLKLEESKWRMTGLAPHVAIRLKHIFPRIAKWQKDDFVFPNDTSHCADLSWFTSRYPLQISLDDQLTLEGGRSQFEGEQAEMEAILKPDYSPPTDTYGLKPGQKIRKYQAQARDLTLARKSLLLGDDVGLGKTYSALALLLEPETLPASVVVETHLPEQWQEKAEAFTNLRIHQIKGTKPYSLPEADLYIFRYSQLLGWIDTFQDGWFKAVIFDEIQQLRRGLDSGKGIAAKTLADAAQYRLGLSATPIYNYGAEIWNIMMFIDPAVLGDKGEFMREWCPDGKVVSDPEALGAYLREQKIFLRRTKKDVGQEMPPINTLVEHVPSDSKTLASIEALARELAMRTTTGTFMERGRAGRELDLLMRHTTGVAKAKGVANYVRILLEAGEPVLLAGWHRDVYDIWLDELADFAPAMYTGSESPRQKADSVRRFVEAETNLFIISLRSGAGLDGLQHRCTTIVFGELDWSPKVHEQVIGRLYREWQKWVVNAIYLNTDEGSDPPIVELLGLKASQSHGIVDLGVQLDVKRSDKTRIQALALQYLAKRKAA